MKKKIVALCLCVALAVIAIGGATLAYFTDTDTKTNTFTLGKVDITLTETDNNGNPYVDNQKLIPGSNMANTVAKNAIVTVDKDSEDSWVWVEVLIPETLYASKTEVQESYNALHYNQFKDYIQGYDGQHSTLPQAIECVKTYPADYQWSLMKYIDTVTVGSETYARLRTTHKDIVAAGTSTSPAVNQFYMASQVDTNENGEYVIPTGTETGRAVYTGTWEVIINAYAVQAAGIANVGAAVAAFDAK